MSKLTQLILRRALLGTAYRIVGCLYIKSIKICLWVEDYPAELKFVCMISHNDGFSLLKSLHRQSIISSLLLPLLLSSKVSLKTPKYGPIHHINPIGTVGSVRSKHIKIMCSVLWGWSMSTLAQKQIYIYMVWMSSYIPHHIVVMLLLIQGIDTSFRQ